MKQMQGGSLVHQVLRLVGSIYGGALHAKRMALCLQRITTNILQAGVQEGGMLHRIVLMAGQLHHHIAPVSVPLVLSGVVGSILGKLHQGMAGAVEDWCLVCCADSKTAVPAVPICVASAHAAASQAAFTIADMLPQFTIVYCCSCCDVCYRQHRNAHRLTQCCLQANVPDEEVVAMVRRLIYVRPDANVLNVELAEVNLHIGLCMVSACSRHMLHNSVFASPMPNETHVVPPYLMSCNNSASAVQAFILLVCAAEEAAAGKGPLQPLHGCGEKRLA